MPGGHDGGMRVLRWLVALTVPLALCCTSCSSDTASRSTDTTAPTTGSTSPLDPAAIRAELARATAVTAIGDSVPYGTACNCTPYPQLTASDLTRFAGHPVSVSNDSMPGFQSSDVVSQLEDDPGVIAHVESSEVVLAEIGANDVAYSPSCGTNVSCYDAKLPSIEHNLDSIVERVHDLTRGHELTLLLLDYWSVWLGGQYAHAQGPAYVTAADEVTDHVDTAIREIAQSTGSVYVDLRTAFRGPNQSWDETHLLAPDGDHPDAEGHVRIARAIAYTVAA
jgi:lysophospholipase L1-like esterase